MLRKPSSPSASGSPLAPSVGQSRQSGPSEAELTAEQKEQRRKRVAQKVEDAIETLAIMDHSAAASVLRIGRIEVLDPADALKLGVSTAALIRHKGMLGGFRIVFNARFCDRSVDDIVFIVFHELMHHIMRHLEGDRTGEDSRLSNVVEDAFINQLIHQSAPQISKFPRDYYPADQAPYLFLRSRSKPVVDLDNEFYTALYTSKLVEQQLYEYLKDRGDDTQQGGGDGDGEGQGQGQGQGGQGQGGTGGERDENGELPDGEYELIGSHDPQLRDGENPLDVEQLPEMCDEVRQGLRRNGQAGKEGMAGRFDQMVEEFLETHRLGRHQEVERIMRDSLVDAVRSQLITDVIGDLRSQPNRRVLMPERLHRADRILMSVGVTPTLWRKPRQDQKSGKVVVYIDVSGSMHGLVQFVYGCVVAFEEFLDTGVFLFSNGISEITVDELRKGKVNSTGGTDFDCVVEHLLGQDAERAVLFTDGWAGLRDDLAERLRRENKKMVGAVTHNGDDRVLNTFCEKVHRLPDLRSKLR